MNEMHQKSGLPLKSIIISAFLLFALSGITSVTAEDKVLRVEFEKSLLDTPAGIENVYKKLKVTTRRACERPIGNSIHVAVACNREVLAQFVDKLDDLRLTHYAKTGQHLNNQMLVSK